jgi:hypothetical protein
MDVLHEGPVPAALDLDELSEVRANFVAGMGWGKAEEVHELFAHRNQMIRRFREFSEVVLWFEHDLYDQLQLTQILDWLLAQNRGKTRISLISIGKFPGIGRFKGLGQLTSDQLFSLFDQRQDVTLADYKLATEAWHAFRGPDPKEIEALLGMHTTGLPFLKGALARHLEQFPSVKTGLCRTEKQILEVVITGVQRFEDLFLAEQDKEERVFMGDNVFWQYVERLKSARVPLLEMKETSVRVTASGHRVMVGNEDTVLLNGVDRWLGGVHLCGTDVEWRWDERNRKLVKKDNGFANRN